MRDCRISSPAIAARMMVRPFSISASTCLRTFLYLDSALVDFLFGQRIGGLELRFPSRQRLRRRLPRLLGQAHASTCLDCLGSSALASVSHASRSYRRST